MTTVALFACSKEEKVDSNLIVFHANAFKSEAYEVEINENSQLPGIDKTETRYRVIHFKEGGILEFYEVDGRDEVKGVKSKGSYKISYPKITNITLVSNQTETEVTRPSDGSGMYFYLDGLRYSQ